MYYACIHDIRIRPYICVPRPYPGQNGFFSFFEGSFLEAPRAVLFHTTVVHCHHGIDIKDASLFVLE